LTTQAVGVVCGNEGCVAGLGVNEAVQAHEVEYVDGVVLIAVSHSGGGADAEYLVEKDALSVSGVDAAVIIGVTGLCRGWLCGGFADTLADSVVLISGFCVIDIDQSVKAVVGQRQVSDVSHGVRSCLLPL